MPVRKLREALDIENRDGRVCDRLSENAFGVGLDQRLNLLVGAVLIKENALDAHLLHRHTEQIVGAAVDRRRSKEAVAALADVEHCVEIRSLARGCQHTCVAAFHRRDFRSNRVVGRILQAGVEVARSLQVKQSAHGVAGVILKSRALVNRKLSRLPLGRLPAFMDTLGFDLGHVNLLWPHLPRRI